jgi:hypothetical protein
LQGSNRSRGFAGIFARHKRKDKIYRILQGLICKIATSSPTFGSEQRTGAGGWRTRWPAGLGAPAAWGLDWFVQEVEEIEGISGSCSPWRERTAGWPAALASEGASAQGVGQRRSDLCRMAARLAGSRGAGGGLGRRAAGQPPLWGAGAGPQRRRRPC